MKDLIAAEWVKLRSVRWSWHILLYALSGIIVPALIAWNVRSIWDRATPLVREHITVSPLTAAIGALLVNLFMGVLGVLVFTSEYSTGMIATSLAAVPHRGKLLAAKAIVVAGVSLVAGEAILMISFLCTDWIIGSRPIPFLTTSFSQVVPVLLSLGLGAMVFALVGLGLGCTLRSTAGAIVALIAGFLYLVPIVAIHLPVPWNDWVSAMTIMHLAGAVSGQPKLAAMNHALLSPPWALLGLTIYVVAALGIANLFIRHRDI